MNSSAGSQSNLSQSRSRPAGLVDSSGNPEIIQELLNVSHINTYILHSLFWLQTNSEWTNIQDIVKLTFKGIYQTLKV